MLILKNKTLKYFGSIDPALLVVGRRLVLGVEKHHFLDAVMPHVLQLLPLPVLPSVQPLAVATVDWFGTWRPAQAVRTGHDQPRAGTQKPRTQGATQLEFI